MKMTEDFKHKKLLHLIRHIAREETRELINEHLEDYLHKEKPAEEVSSNE